MNLTYWYAVGIAGLALLCLHRIVFIGLSLLHSRVRVSIVKYFTYPLLVRRRYWGSVNRLQAILLSGYVVTNGICMGLGIRTTSDLISRSGTMASINLIPLFFGGRTSMIANILGISLHSYYLAHHWIGRVVIIQGLLHVGLVIVSSPKWTFDSFQISGISAASAMSLILLCSFYFVRRLMYEFFLKLHLLLALVCIFAMLDHVLPLGLAKSCFPIAALCLWGLNTVVRLVRICFYNIGGGVHDRSEQVSILHHLNSSGSTVGAMTVHIKLRRSMKVRPGQYFYLFLSDLGFRRRFQAHPFTVAWWDDPVKAKNLSFLIQPQNGLSADLIRRNSLRSVTLDGPYGIDHRIEDHEMVILVAKGIGIAGVLPYARYLLDMRFHQDRRYRRALMTRKIDLFWIMDDNCQEDWISKWLSELKDKDAGRFLLSVWCYYPQKKAKEPSIKCDEYYRCFYEERPKLRDLICAEVSNSPGRTVIAACGVARFAGIVRAIVTDTISKSVEVKFVEVEFRPQRVNHSHLKRSKESEWAELSGLELETSPGRVQKAIAGTWKKSKSRLSSIEEGLENIVAPKEFV